MERYVKSIEICLYCKKYMFARYCVDNQDLSVENVYLLLDLPGFGGGAEIAGGHQGGSDRGHHVRVLPRNA